jgi:hypothetical protein
LSALQNAVHDPDPAEEVPDGEARLYAERGQLLLSEAQTTFT